MVAWFTQADICWITPIRDGLNLVAKEYVAARKGNTGVLVLSEFTGPSVLINGAILTNHYSQNKMDASFHEAISIPQEEKLEITEMMTSAVELYTVKIWVEEQIKSVEL